MLFLKWHMYFCTSLNLLFLLYIFNLPCLLHEALFHIDYRFRSTTKTLDTTESMSYAVIRGLLKKGETERLLRMLKDKVCTYYKIAWIAAEIGGVDTFRSFG